MPLYIHAGASMQSYMGDLGTFKQWSSGLHLGIHLRNGKKINGGVNFAYGAIVGDQLDYQSEVPGATPNTHFNTTLFTAQFNLRYNFLKWKNLQLYISQGIGIIRFEPKNQFGEKLLDQFDTRAANETYSNIAAMLPTQLGAYWRLPNELTLGLQAGLSNTLTDYLDNISQWGSSNNDNIFQVKFMVQVPITLKL